MSATQFLIPYPIVAKPTNIGAPGSTITFYQPETTTLKATYTDATLTTLQANPLTADGAGRWDDIYLDGAELYKIVIEDKNGAELYNQDPYTPGVISSITGPPGDVAKVADRAALAAITGQAAKMSRYLAESGREGMFVWSSSDLQTALGASLATIDPNQALYVAPASDATGASGAWVRKFTGAAESTWWGVATTATAANNVSYFNAALATLRYLATTSYGYNIGSIGLHTPAGHYNFNAEIVLDHALEVFGDYTGSGGGTVFSWTSNTSGFGLRGDVNNSNGAHIRNLVLYGTNAGSNCHAINQLGYGNISDIYVNSWSGDGVYANGVPPSGLSGSTWANILGDAVGWVLHIDGGDSNGCTSRNIGAGSARFGGIMDSSGIGCNHYLGVINSCGNVSGYATHCVYSSKGYSVAFGQEAGASTNAPSGTTANNTWWIYDAGLTTTVSATAPAWTSGLTWYFSAPICIQPDDNNVQSTVVGGYVEQGLNPIIVNTATTLVRGQWLCSVLVSNGTKASFIRGTGTAMEFNNAIQTDGPSGNNFQQDTHTFGGLTSTDTTINLKHGSASTTIQFFKSGVADGQLVNVNAQLIHRFDTHYIQTKAGGAIADFSSTGLNLASGVPLRVNTVSIINGSGVLQAAGFPALTGDVTTSAGALATTIAANVVTYAKFQQVAASSIVGNPTGSLANAQGITLAADHSFSGTTLQLGAFTGDITKSAGSLATTIGANAVTYAKFQQVAASSLVGNATGSLANATGITLGATLTFSGSALQTAALTGDVTASANSFATTIAANVVTYAKFQQVAASSLVGNATGSLANATGITLAGGLAFSGSTLTAAGALTPTSVASTGAITSSSATAGVGYAAGAGGTASQSTSKATTVSGTNKRCVDITLNAAALAASTTVSFTFTNTAIVATDNFIINHISVGTFGAYTFNARAAAGSATIDVRNVSLGSLSEAIVIRVTAISGANT